MNMFESELKRAFADNNSNYIARKGMILFNEVCKLLGARKKANLEAHGYHFRAEYIRSATDYIKMSLLEDKQDLKEGCNMAVSTENSIFTPEQVAEMVELINEDRGWLSLRDYPRLHNHIISANQHKRNFIVIGDRVIKFEVCERDFRLMEVGVCSIFDEDVMDKALKDIRVKNDIAVTISNVIKHLKQSKEDTATNSSKSFTDNFMEQYGDKLEDINGHKSMIIEVDSVSLMISHVDNEIIFRRLNYFKLG
ncbi:hypothetical protein [Vibrio phage YC]|uniref:Uncharacterized protein n=1 Tax=Vibrio phage YC TaxID=2267403 RepID=A0A384ZS83_9CAUD|nr:hypothetical protein HWB64_gp128 [Vibrio phage YC]AXC34497.1 hypothetical protein [Vibrio phage YC]